MSTAMIKNTFKSYLLKENDKKKFSDKVIDVNDKNNRKRGEKKERLKKY